MMHTKSSIRRMLATRRRNKKEAKRAAAMSRGPEVTHLRKVIDSPNVEVQRLQTEVGHLHNLLDAIRYLIENARGNKR